jgi:hypothetical protein
VHQPLRACRKAEQGLAGLLLDRAGPGSEFVVAERVDVRPGIDGDILRDAYRAAMADDIEALIFANQRGVAFRTTAEMAVETTARWSVSRYLPRRVAYTD